MALRYTDPFGPPWKFSWFRLLLHWAGSIFQFLWIEWFFATLAAAGACTLMVYWFDYYQDLQAWRRDTELLAHALDYVTQRFQAAISLMLGFYTITLYNRWWSVRGKMQAASSSIKDIALQLAMIKAVDRFEESVEDQAEDDGDQTPSTSETSNSMPRHPLASDGAEPTPPEKPKRKTLAPPTPTRSTIRYKNTARHVRLTMVRWINLAHALAVRDLIERKPNEFSTMEDLQNLGLINDKEINNLQLSLPKHEPDPRSVNANRQLDPPRQYDIPIAWVFEWIYQLNQSDHFNMAPILISILNASLVNIRENLDALFMYRDTPVPMFYRQLVTLTIRLYMIIFLIGDGIIALQHVVDIATEEVVNMDLDGGATTTVGDQNLSTLLKTAYYMIIPFSFEYFVFVG